VNVAREAGFFGWSLFIGDNKPYHARNFADQTKGDAFDPAKPINDSKYNTGARELPPAQPAMIYYPYAESPEFPQIGTGGRNAMAGPVFYHDDYNDSEHKLPAYYDGKFFFYDWMRDQIMAADLDETGYVTDFERFLPTTELLHPMDMMFSQNGELFILEYGRKWFARNNDARLIRIRYNSGNRAPVAKMEVAETIGGTPFQLTADASGSIDYDGDELDVTWLLNDQEIGKGMKLDKKITTNGAYTLAVVTDDGQGHAGRREIPLIVGNGVPEVTIELDGNRSFFYPGKSLTYNVKVTDVEDGDVDPKAITVSLDYLEGEDLVQIEQGHQVAGKGTAFSVGKSLVAGSDCKSCHLENEKNIGPSYQRVADKYRDRGDAVAYLSGKIIAGGGGVWGERVMAAHPDLERRDANQMAEYILSLAGPSPYAESRPARGTIKLDQHKAGTPGRYYLRASYTDEGSGDGLPRLTTTQVVVLRSPKLAADKFTSGKKVMAHHITAEDNPLGDDAFDVLVATGGGWASYGDFDLAGIKTIKAEIALAPGITSGGTIDVMAGHPTTGRKVATAGIKQGISTYGMNELYMKVTESTIGAEPLFFRFKAADGGAEAVLGAVLSFEFMREELTK